MNKLFTILLLVLPACGEDICCLFEAEGICFVESNTSPEIASELAALTIDVSIEVRPDLFTGIRNKIADVGAQMYIRNVRPKYEGRRIEGLTIDSHEMYVYHEGDDVDCLAKSAFSHEMLHVMVDAVELDDNGDGHGHDGMWGIGPSWDRPLEHEIASRLMRFCERVGYVY